MPFEYDDRTRATRPGAAAAGAASAKGALKGASYAEGQAALQMKPKEGLVFIGMGDHAHDEAKHLRKITPEGVTAIHQRGKKQDQYKGFDLTTDDGIKGFVATLGVPAAKAAELKGILDNVGGDAKDEVAQILEVFGQAQRGERTMSRVVLSGHSLGDSIWGDTNGDIEFDILDQISKAFPKAAAQVEDLMLSACYGGGEAIMDTYFAMFPAVKTIWAYHDSSPGTWSGAMPHMTRWERATRGNDPSKVKADLAKGTRKGKNVSVWTATGGYDGAERKPVKDLMDAVSAGESVYNEHFSGAVEVTNTQVGPLRSYYNAIQAALAHPQLPDTDRKKLQKQRDVTIRLIYFKVVRAKFTAQYRSQISAAYKAIGQTAPDYSKMGRGAAVAAVKKFKADGGGGAAMNLLETGLIALDNSIIPNTWV